MAGTQEVLAIDKGLARQQRQRLGHDFDDALAVKRGERNVVARQLPVRRIVLAQRKKLMERSLAHAGLPNGSAPQNLPFAAGVKPSAGEVTVSFKSQSRRKPGPTLQPSRVQTSGSPLSLGFRRDCDLIAGR